MSTPDPRGGRFDIDAQRAQSITNIGRDQIVEGTDLGRPGRGGPWTMGVGGLIFLVGAGFWGFAVLSSALQVFTIVGEGMSSDSTAPPVGGFDFHTGLLATGGAIAFAGIVVFFIGLFVTVVSWRRRSSRR